MVPADSSEDPHRTEADREAIKRTLLDHYRSDMLKSDYVEHGPVAEDDHFIKTYFADRSANTLEVFISRSIVNQKIYNFNLDEDNIVILNTYSPDADRDDIFSAINITHHDGGIFANVSVSGVNSDTFLAIDEKVFADFLKASGGDSRAASRALEAAIMDRICTDFGGAAAGDFEIG